jgi:hypothetical protein
MRRDEKVPSMEGLRNAYKMLVGEPEGQNRGEDNINMDFKEIKCDYVEWIHLAHYTVKW